MWPHQLSIDKHACVICKCLRGMQQTMWDLTQMDSTLDTYDSGGEEDEPEEGLEDPGLNTPSGLPAPSVDASDLDSNAGAAMPTPSIAGTHPTGPSAQEALQLLHSLSQRLMMCQHQQGVTPLGGPDGLFSCGSQAIDKIA